MSETSHFWLGFFAGMVCGAVEIVVIVELSRWMYNRIKGQN